MNGKLINEAILEAERFIATGRKALRAMNPENGADARKDVAACRRASLDLTRKLAELRKG